LGFGEGTAHDVAFELEMAFVLCFISVRSRSKEKSVVGKMTTSIITTNTNTNTQRKTKTDTNKNKNKRQYQDKAPTRQRQ
jgi:hypothetical protein